MLAPVLMIVHVLILGSITPTLSLRCVAPNGYMCHFVVAVVDPFQSLLRFGVQRRTLMSRIL